MIKTLRITGVAAVAFAGVVLASVLGPVSMIHLDDRSDQKMAKILDAPSAVERFREQHGDNDQSSQDTTPPLVKQAEAFKGIIDPPVKVETVAAPVGTTIPTIPRPVTKSAPTTKFTLIGTSYSSATPNSSFAYLRLPDNTYQWVQCGSEIGHMVIKEVRESSVVCWDGTRDNEVPIEAVPERVSLVEADGATPTSAAAVIPQPVEVKIAERRAGQSRFSARQDSSRTQVDTPPMNDDEQEALNDLADRLKKLQNLPGDGGPASEAERRAAVSKLASEFNSSRVSPQETKKLESLGDEPGSDSERAREERKRDLVRRLNAGRASEK